MQRHADDVIFGLLRRERAAARLRVETKLPTFRVGSAETFAHDDRPQFARGAELGDFFEELVMRVEEEGELRREIIDG